MTPNDERRLETIESMVRTLLQRQEDRRKGTGKWVASCAIGVVLLLLVAFAADGVILETTNAPGGAMTNRIVITKEEDPAFIKFRNSHLYIEKASAGATAEVRFYDTQGTPNYAGFKAPTTAAGTMWTLPTSGGSVNQALGLTGAGQLGWLDSVTTITGGTGVNPDVATSGAVTISADLTELSLTGLTAASATSLAFSYSETLAANTLAADAVQFGSNGTTNGVIFEGDTSNGFEGLLISADVTADQTWTLPNASGTVITTGNLTSITATGTITSGTWNGSTVGVGYGGTGTSTAFTAGSVVFAGAGGAYTQDNSNFFFDDTNNELGIGISPTVPLHVKPGAAVGNVVRFDRPDGSRIYDFNCADTGYGGGANGIFNLESRAATAVTTMQHSPSLLLRAQYWTVGPSQNQDWWITSMIDNTAPVDSSMNFGLGAATLMTLRKDGRLSGLAAPTASSDAATKGYVDAQAGGSSPWTFVAALNSTVAASGGFSADTYTLQNGVEYLIIGLHNFADTTASSSTTFVFLETYNHVGGLYNLIENFNDSDLNADTNDTEDRIRDIASRGFHAAVDGWTVATNYIENNALWYPDMIEPCVVTMRGIFTSTSGGTITTLNLTAGSALSPNYGYIYIYTNGVVKLYDSSGTQDVAVLIYRR